MIRFGIRTALIALVCVPLLGVFAGGLFALKAIEDRFEARLQEDIALIAHALQNPLSRSLERQRDRSVDRALWSAYEIGPVYGVYVYDADGDLLASADRGPNPGRLRGIDIEGDAGGEYRAVAGREVYSYFAPLTARGGQIIGMLQVTRERSEIRDYISTLYIRSVWGLLLFVLALGLIVFIGHYLAVGRPLKSLAGAMDRVAAGDTGVRVQESGPQEMRQLARSFNGMLANLTRLSERLHENEKYAMVGRLASGVAHELGTPLAVIDGHAQRMARKKTQNDDEATTLRGIRAAVARMSEVIRALLSFGRASHASRSEVPLERLVALAATDAQERAVAARVTIETRAAAGGVLNDADEGRLREALGHLLRNAIHASGVGGRVRIGWRRCEQGSVLFVEDSGRGISDEEAERIFEPFFTTKEPGEGSGLGLAIVQGVAADHGANMHVYRSELGGAGFEIRFFDHE